MHQQYFKPAFRVIYTLTKIKHKQIIRNTVHVFKSKKKIQSSITSNQTSGRSNLVFHGTGMKYSARESETNHEHPSPERSWSRMPVNNWKSAGGNRTDWHFNHNNNFSSSIGLQVSGSVKCWRIPPYLIWRAYEKKLIKHTDTISPLEAAANEGERWKFSQQEKK